jgi:CRISPR-associated endonuclease Csn1
MKGKSDEEFNQYIERVNTLFKNKIIGKTKRDKLLMPQEKIPKDFIERQLRETQYIAKKSKEILEEVCRNVWSTSGSVTEYLRRIWGWDDVLMNLQMPKYRELGLTEWKEWETNNGQKHKKEVIKDWSKRDDHRHHAVDALVIACTQQGFIQRINKLSSDGNKKEMLKAVVEVKKGSSLLETYFVAQKPFNTKEVEEKAAEILISFKAGKKVATTGKRKIKRGGKKQVVQDNIIIPRGALSEESIYGKIKALDRDLKTGEIIKHKPKYLFENPDLIFKGYIKKLVEETLAQFNNDPKQALASLKKEPIYLDKEKTKILEYATCIKEEFVIKYPIESIKEKDLGYIVDKKVRDLVTERLAQFGNKEKEAFKTPLYYDKEQKQPIKSVRMFTGLTSVEPVKKDEAGNNIGYVKPGNNHHIALYINEEGNKIEHSCTFWHAVERKKYNIPVVIKNPKEVWDKILQNKEDYPQNFLEKLPNDKWMFSESLQQNEMFVFGIKQDELDIAIKQGNYKLISQNLYRIQKIGSLLSGWWFRNHIETSVSDGKEIADKKKSKRVIVIQSLENMKGTKVKIDFLGNITKI